MGRKHPNELKLVKQQRMRRAYLKPYSAAMVKVPRGINHNFPEIVDGNDYSAMFAYRQRGMAYWNSILTAKDAPISWRRETVLNKLAELIKDVAPECNVVMHRGGITKTITRMYFTPDFKLVYFIREDYLNHIVQRSSAYCGDGARERAKFAFMNKRIEWVEVVDLPADNPDVPSG